MDLIEIKIVNHVQQYSSYDDGESICKVIQASLENHCAVSLSFEGIKGIPSAFANGLLDSLFNDLGVDGVKQRIHVVHSTNLINDMLRRKFRLASSV